VAARLKDDFEEMLIWFPVLFSVPPPSYVRPSCVLCLCIWKRLFV